MIIVDRALEERHERGRPVKVAMVGAGFMGRGIALPVTPILKSVLDPSQLGVSEMVVDEERKATRYGVDGVQPGEAFAGRNRDHAVGVIRVIVTRILDHIGGDGTIVVREGEAAKVAVAQIRARAQRVARRRVGARATRPRISLEDRTHAFAANVEPGLGGRGWLGDKRQAKQGSEEQRAHRVQHLSFPQPLH
jgi:hypothetical protein